MRGPDKIIALHLESNDRVHRYHATSEQGFSELYVISAEGWKNDPHPMNTLARAIRDDWGFWRYPEDQEARNQVKQEVELTWQ